MRITERQLRSIVKEEISRVEVVKEATAAAGNVTHQVKPGDTISTVIKNYYGIPATSASYPLYNQVAKLSGIADSNKIKPGDVLQLPPNLGGKPRTGAAAPAAGKCDLLSYNASITAQFARLGLAGVGLTALVEVTLAGKYVNQTGDYFIDLGNKIAGFGANFSTGSGGLYDRFKATVASGAKFAADAAMGPVNEIIGASFVAFGTYMKGVQAAIAGFARGGAQECNWQAFAAACGQAWTAAYGAAKSKFAQTFDVNMLTSAIQALITAGVAAFGMAAAAAAAIVTSMIALIRAGAAAIGNALVAAGQALTGAGQAMGGQAPMPESRRIEISRSNRQLNGTIREIVKVATLREQIDSLSPQAAKLLLR
jgi:hypothetical protein